MLVLWVRVLPFAFVLGFAFHLHSAVQWVWRVHGALPRLSRPWCLFLSQIHRAGNAFSTFFQVALAVPGLPAWGRADQGILSLAEVSPRILAPILELITFVMCCTRTQYKGCRCSPDVVDVHMSYDSCETGWYFGGYFSGLLWFPALSSNVRDVVKVKKAPKGSRHWILSPAIIQEKGPQDQRCK